MAFGYNIDQRKINKRNHIVNLFREQRVLSKAQAHSFSAYSMDTILSIFASLIEDNLIVPVAGKQKPKGRKASFYALNTEREVYLGITFNQQGIYSSLISFSHEVVDSFNTPLGLGIDRSGFLSEFERHLRQTIDDTAVSNSIAAIGCSLPGDIELSTGILKGYTLMPFLKDVNFRECIEGTSPGIPVVIDHNVKGLAYYLLHDSDLIDPHEKTAFVSARSATASGLIQNGSIVIGRGEMGHTKVSDQAVKCICGRTGCLDIFFSYRSFLELLPPSPVSRDDESGKGPEFSRLAEFYQVDHSVIKPELDKRLDYFIDALLDLINVTAPDRVLLTGGLFEVFGDPSAVITGKIRKRFGDSGFFSQYRSTKIEYRGLETEVVSAGICFQMIRDKWEYREE
ncbi:MAG: ROK family protein [Proteobacteria bacterium]|nr:ROK family protein [Pseudomonadota bacterium]